MGRSAEHRVWLNEEGVGGAGTRFPYFRKKSGGIFILLLGLNGQPQPLPDKGSKFTDLCDACLLRNLESPRGRGGGGSMWFKDAAKKVYINWLTPNRVPNNSHSVSDMDPS